MIGHNLKFHCSSTNNVKWSKNGEPIPAHIERGISRDLSDYWMSITESNLDDSGHYKCSGEESEYILFTAVVELVVVGDSYLSVQIKTE